MNECEIELTKGQAGCEGLGSCCAHCGMWIKKEDDSVRVEVNYESIRIHLDCFMEMCKSILAKAKAKEKVNFT